MGPAPERTASACALRCFQHRQHVHAVDAFGADAVALRLGAQVGFLPRNARARCHRVEVVFAQKQRRDFHSAARFIDS